MPHGNQAPTDDTGWQILDNMHVISDDDTDEEESDTGSFVDLTSLDEDEDHGEHHPQDLTLQEVEDVCYLGTRRRNGTPDAYDTNMSQPDQPWLRPKLSTERGTSLKSATTAFGVTLRIGDHVELVDEEFLTIKKILQGAGETYLMGVLLKRTCKCRGMFVKRLNELCAILRVADEGLSAVDPNPPVDRCPVVRLLSAVIKQRKIVFTNDPRAHSFRDHRGPPENEKEKREIEENEILVCRQKHVIFCSPYEQKVISGTNAFLRAEEAHNGKRIDDFTKKLLWLEGGTEQGRPKAPTPLVSPGTIKLSYKESSRPRDLKRSSAFIDLTGDAPVDAGRSVKKTANTPKVTLPVRLRRDQDKTASVTMVQPSRKAKAYTYVDICAGAGGMTRGADLAGLKLKLLLDNWPRARDTLELNFGAKRPRVLCVSIFDFVQQPLEAWMHVDILHISYPCQPHSPAHTHSKDEERDNENRDLILSVIQILGKIRPRIVTFEQTSGLLTHHSDWFHALLHQINATGFSVRWKLIKCDELGNVQARNRLFLIASCPGEPLPPFPQPTHGNGPDLRPLVTIADRLALVPRNTPLHMQDYTPKNGTPYDARRPLKHCITTKSGKSDLHPEGWRSFNLQELALLQHFPVYHRFPAVCKTKIRTLIGNATPSIVAKAIFEEVKKSMEAEDERMTNRVPDIVDLSDE